jgi:hypothetical protein
MFTKPNEELVAGNHLFCFPQGFLQLLKFRRKILFRGIQMEVWSCVNEHGKREDFRLTPPRGFTEEDYERYMQE